MTNYINPFDTQRNPVDTSYNNFTFTDLAVMLWATQNITEPNQYYTAFKTDVNPTDNATLQLAVAAQGSTGATFTLTNLSTFTIGVIASDGSNVVNITSGQSLQFTLKATSTNGPESVLWEYIILGVTTNTNTLSQNLGNSLRFITSTNNVQVAQTVNVIQSVLPLSGLNYTLGADEAKLYSGTTLFNEPTTTVQTNVLLAASGTLYAACGYFGTFVNESAYPVVLQTTGDTINGVPLQSTADTASFVLVPGGSVTLAASPNNDWLIMNQSTQFQSVFKTATINFSTANYVYLAHASGLSYVETNLTDSGHAAAVAIDMSKNLDLIYSPLWNLTGTVPSGVASLMATLGQTIVWIILPNNLSYIYFLQARLTVETYSVGLAVKYGASTAVGLPPTINARPAGNGSTWAFQYSAQVNPAAVNLPAQFISGLLIADSGGGGGGGYEFIKETGTLISITGTAGLYVPNGPANFTSAYIGGKAIAVVVPDPVNGDLVSTDAAGNTVDSGVAVSNDVTMGGLTPSEKLVPTQYAVSAYISDLITGIIVFKGTWDAATNTPTLTAGVGVGGNAYIISVTGTQTAPSGSPVLYTAGNFIVYDPRVSYWVEIAAGTFVTSVNGATGVVQLYLNDILGVSVPTPTVGYVLTWNGTNWVDSPAPGVTGLTGGTTVTATVPFIATSGLTVSASDFTVDTGQATFGVASPPSLNPPLYLGGYGASPNPNSLATIGYITNFLSLPDIVDVPGTSVSIINGAVLNAGNGLNVTGTSALGVTNITGRCAVTGSVSATTSAAIGTVLNVGGAAFFSTLSNGAQVHITNESTTGPDNYLTIEGENPYVGYTSGGFNPALLFTSPGNAQLVFPYGAVAGISGRVAMPTAGTSNNFLATLGDIAAIPGDILYAYSLNINFTNGMATLHISPPPPGKNFISWVNAQLSGNISNQVIGSVYYSGADNGCTLYLLNSTVSVQFSVSLLIRWR